MADQTNQSPQNITAEPDYFTLYIGQAVECVRDEKFHLAVIKLDLAIRCDPNGVETRWWYYYYKSHWLELAGKTDDALKVIDEGISSIGYPPILLYCKADLLLRLKNDFNQAIIIIKQAEEIFDSNTPDYKAQINDLPTQLQDIENNLRTEFTFKMSLNMLRFQANIKASEQTINNKVAYLELKLDKERTNTIEIVSIFTAVMALIIVGGSLIVKMPPIQAIKVLIGLGAILAIFITLSSYIFDQTLTWFRLINQILILIFASTVLFFLLKFS